jgi:hypothetical protein
MRAGGTGDDQAVALEAKARSLLRAGRPKAALSQAQKALALRAGTAGLSPGVVSTVVLVADCHDAAGRPVVAVEAHAQAVLWLAELVPYSGADREEPPSAGIGRWYELAACAGLPAFDAEAARLRDRLRKLVAPFETGGPAEERARFATLRPDEVAALPQMMINVNEATTTCFRRRQYELCRDLGGAMATLGRLSQHLGEGYRRPCVRALFDLAGLYQVSRDYGEMWLWMRVALDVAAVFVSEPDDANLRLMMDALDVASKGLLSAGLSAQAARTQAIAQQMAELTRTTGPHRVAMAALIGTRLAELIREIDALLLRAARDADPHVDHGEPEYQPPDSASHRRAGAPRRRRYRRRPTQN